MEDVIQTEVRNHFSHTKLVPSYDVDDDEVQGILMDIVKQYGYLAVDASKFLHVSNGQCRQNDDICLTVREFGQHS